MEPGLGPQVLGSCVGVGNSCRGLCSGPGGVQVGGLCDVGSVCPQSRTSPPPTAPTLLTVLACTRCCPSGASPSLPCWPFWITDIANPPTTRGHPRGKMGLARGGAGRSYYGQILLSPPSPRTLDLHPVPLVGLKPLQLLEIQGSGRFQLLLWSAAHERLRGCQDHSTPGVCLPVGRGLQVTGLGLSPLPKSSPYPVQAG